MRTSKYKNYEDLPLMLSVPEAGEVLGISISTVEDRVAMMLRMPACYRK